MSKSYAELLGKVIEITEDGTQLALTPAQIVERLRDRETMARDMLAAAAAIASPENYDNIRDTLWMPGNCPSTIFDFLGGDSDAAEVIALEAGRVERAEKAAAASDDAAYAAIFIRSEHCADDRCRGAEYPCGDCIGATSSAELGPAVFSGWNLSRMRKYQATVNLQIPLAFAAKNTVSLERLQSRAANVTEAILRSEFGTD